MWRWRYGIEAVIGYPGSGKSLLAVDWALRAMKKGRPVMSNMAIAGCHPLSYRQFLAGDLVPGSLVVVDEASRWFDSRAFARTSSEFLTPFLQGRKQGLALLWTAQRFGSVDVLIRDVSSRIWVATPLGLGYRGLIYDRSPIPFAFRYQAYRRHRITDAWETVGRLMVSPVRLGRLYKAYSTLETIGRPGAG